MTNYKKLSRAQMIRELEKRDRIIEREESLWKTREGRENRHGNPGSAFRREALREILDDPDDIHSMTGSTAEEFGWILARLTEYLLDHEDKMRLVRIKGSGRGSDPGNRCALDPEYALLLSLTHKKHNPTQESLAATFGIDQSSVSRYLDDIDIALDAALPTGNNVGEGIVDGTIDAEKAVPEGVALLDGCETPTQRPSEPKAKKAAYSGKKKRHTRNTLFATTLAGIIIYMSRPRPGRAHDMRILKKEKNRINRLLRAMLVRLRIYADKGFTGMGRHVEADAMVPRKRSKHRPLTEADRARNRMINEIRIVIEHVFACLKKYARLADPYNSDDARFARELSVITGLANLHAMWPKLRRRVRRGEPPPHWLAYFE